MAIYSPHGIDISKNHNNIHEKTGEFNSMAISREILGEFRQPVNPDAGWIDSGLKELRQGNSNRKGSIASDVLLAY
jgi:hypothetical protein